MLVHIQDIWCEVMRSTQRIVKQSSIVAQSDQYRSDFYEIQPSYIKVGIKSMS